MIREKCKNCEYSGKPIHEICRSCIDGDRFKEKEDDKNTKIDKHSEYDPSALRIGKKIRTIRNARGLSISQLGEKVNLSADRIGKYENGYRKPKKDMILSFAKALSVHPDTLSDLSFDTCCDCMRAFFELEHEYNAKVEELDDAVCIKFDKDTPLYYYMLMWYDEYRTILSDIRASDTKDTESIIKKYWDWQWNFSDQEIEEAERQYKKAFLQSQIEELTKELNNL